MALPWILTTPASRGIGLELTRHLLKTSDLPIVATARKDLQGTKERILDGLDVDKNRLEVLELDVTSNSNFLVAILNFPSNETLSPNHTQTLTPTPHPDEATISAAASHCKYRFAGNPLRLAFCIPGILHPEKSPSAISHAHALSTFKTNTLGPLLLLKHFSPFLPTRRTTLPPARNLSPTAIFALMSARVGSITDNRAGGWYSYRSSKAAVNQLAKSLDIHLRLNSGDNAMCVALHPGTVKTALSEEFWESTPSEELFSPEYAAERLCEVVKGLGVEGRGKCWDWEGKEIPP